MEEEKRTYGSEVEMIPELRLQLHREEEQEICKPTESSLNRDGRFLSEELIADLIEKIKAL